MSNPRTVLVTGATGQQGGAVARALLRKGHTVRFITRRPDAPAAGALTALGATALRADFADPASLVAALRGVDALYAMSTPFEAGMAAETAQGIALVDAARAAAVPHVVFSSVSDADRSTGIPHFDSKYAVEQHLRASGLAWTILAPVFFLENLKAPWMLPALQQGTLALALPAHRPLQMVALDDHAGLAVLAIERPEQFVGRRIDVASDELTLPQAARALSDRTGRTIVHREQSLDEVRAWSEDTALMFAWFDRVGYSADIAGLRRAYPEVGWHTFASWAQEQDWSALGQPVAG